MERKKYKSTSSEPAKAKKSFLDVSRRSNEPLIFLASIYLSTNNRSKLGNERSAETRGRVCLVSRAKQFYIVQYRSIFQERNKNNCLITNFIF